MRRLGLVLACVITACSVDSGSARGTASATLWTQSDNDMHSPRTLHRAVLLDPGTSAARALVMGGASAIKFPGFLALSTAEIYDGGKFTLTGPMHVGRVLHGAIRLADGRVLVTGGASGLDSGTSSAEIWEAGSFRYVTSSSTTHAAHTVSLLPDHRVLVLGGYLTSSAEIFDPKTETFTAAAPLSSNVGAHSATRLADGRLLIAGGGPSWDQSSKATFVYDPKTGVAPLPALSVERAGHTATLLADGRVLLVGGAKDGVIGGERQSTAEIFDPSSNSWKAAAPSAHRRVFHVAELLPTGHVLVAGGDPDGILNGIDESSAEIYDPAGDRWMPAGSMSTGRTAAAAISLGGGKLVVTGGFNGESQASVDVFSIVGLGGACTSNSGCVTGFCVDGVCCARACRGACEACDGAGACKPLVGAPRAGHESCEAYVCGAAGCLTACANDVDCATGFACKHGKCERDAASVCSTDRRATVGANGVVASCGAYLCTAGACQSECASSGQCAPGYVCDLESARCVSALAGTSAGGCALGGAHPGTHPAAAEACGVSSLLLLPLLMRRRRRASGARRLCLVRPTTLSRGATLGIWH